VLNSNIATQDFARQFIFSYRDNFVHNIAKRIFFQQYAVQTANKEHYTHSVNISCTPLHIPIVSDCDLMGAAAANLPSRL
jgi:thiamine transporter ThiT